MTLADKKLEDYLDLNAIPSGRNDLSTRSAFYQEQIYNNVSFRTIQGKLNAEPIDYNYDFINLGKVDDNENIIILKEESLKQSSLYSKKILQNLNFVIDAFDDFLQLINRAKLRGLINQTSPFYNLTSVNGYVDLLDLYQNHFVSQSRNFLVFLKENNIENNISNFDQFISYFINFIDLQAVLVPFSLSAFNVSKFSNPRTTGLVFELFGDDKSDDRNKFLNYLEDPYYPIFFNAATEVGFSIDRDVPWRLIANIDSLKMQKYMSKYNINKKTFFQANYDKINLLDFDLFKKNIINLYNSFIKYNEFSVEKKVKKCKNNFIVEQNIKYRQKYKKNNDIWLRLYTYVRARENNINWDQATFDTIVEEAEKINSALDIQRSLRHIDRSVNLEIASRKVNRNFQF